MSKLEQTFTVFRGVISWLLRADSVCAINTTSYSDLILYVFNPLPNALLLGPITLTFRPFAHTNGRSCNDFKNNVH